MSRDVPAPAPSGKSLLPLAFRLPNPPPGFRDRGPELATVTGWLAQGPVALLHGPPQSGKSALALAAAARWRADGGHPEHAAHVGAAALGAEPLEARLRRILALGDLPSPDWGPLAIDAAAARAALIDLADAGRWLVVVDDVDTLGAPDLALLSDLARYAQVSRWILTARVAPAGLVQAAPALRLAPQAATTPPPPLPAVDDDALAATRARLAWLRRPADGPMLAALGLAPDSPDLRALDHAGELARAGDAVALRRPPPAPTDPAEAHALAQRLAALPAHDDAHLEALRLWLIHGHGAAAQALLTRVGHALCERGLAGDAFRLLEAAPAALAAHAELADWHRWCAREWGDPAARDAVVGEARSWLGHLLSARVARQAGDGEGAVAAAAVALSQAPTPRGRDLARLEAARGRFGQGRFADALTHCAALEERAGAVAVEAALLEAEVAALTGDGDAAAARVEALLGAGGLSPALALRGWLGMARLYLMGQRLRDAERVLEGLLATRADRAGDALSGRITLEMAANAFAQRAAFDRARAIADRLERAGHIPAARLLFVRASQVVADEWQGAPADFEATVRALAHDCDRMGPGMAADVRAFADQLLARVALNEARPPEALGPPQPAEVPTGLMATNRDLTRARHAARWGHALAAPPLDDPALAATPREHQALVTLAHATARLAAGAAEAADAALDAAWGLLEPGGHTLQQLDIHRLRLWTAFARGDADHLARTAAAVAAVAATLRLPRLAEEAAFFAQGRLAPPEQLEAWAADRAGARTRCRWARWWLGADGPLDPLEAAAFEATALPGWQRADGVTGPEAWAPGWGLDQARGVVWCGPEVVGDLSRHATLRGLLEALLDLGGRADKEQLIARAWGIDDYHPLQHDNRLRVAVRKLRGRLGPAGAEVIETLEDGYALVGVWRILGG